MEIEWTQRVPSIAEKKSIIAMVFSIAANLSAKRNQPPKTNLACSAAPDDAIGQNYRQFFIRCCRGNFVASANRNHHDLPIPLSISCALGMLKQTLRRNTPANLSERQMSSVIQVEVALLETVLSPEGAQ